MSIDEMIKSFIDDAKNNSNKFLDLLKDGVDELFNSFEERPTAEDYRNRAERAEAELAELRKEMNKDG